MFYISVIIPTYNAGSRFKRLMESLVYQSGICYELIIIDSSSMDDTISIAEKYTDKIIVIPSSDFNHGSTRAKAVKLANNDLIVFLTQDVILTPFALINLVKFLKKYQLVAAYGRQRSHDSASPIAQHLRLFNYPNIGYISTVGSVNLLGMKCVFMSNSFSIYDRATFYKVGGFPKDTILGEDMYIAAKMLLAGYKVGYCSEACVKHSHNYTPSEEFKRYFDIGVFHASEPWIQNNFGRAGGEGKRFIISEFKYLFKNAPAWIPRACITNICKIVGYKLGKNYQKLPSALRVKLSMHKAYWLQKDSSEV